MMWYCALIAFLAIPWKERLKKNPTGTLFKEYYLLQANDAASALRKAEIILDIGENTEGTARMGKQRVSYQKVGVFELEPIEFEMKSGVEIFDEWEPNIASKDANAMVLKNGRLSRLLAYDSSIDRPPSLMPVNWGPEFDQT